jgi:hypothetical protein
MENPDSGTMAKDDLALDLADGSAGDEAGGGIEAGERGVVAGLGNGVVGGLARGVVAGVGVSSGGGRRGMPLVRLVYRVVVTKTVERDELALAVERGLLT